MNNFLILFRVFLTRFAIISIATGFLGSTIVYASCPKAVGDKVELLTPESVFAHLSVLNIEKDEFESTREYKGRRDAIFKKIGPNKPYFVKGSFESKYAIYDADKEVFNVDILAFDNMLVPWADVVPQSWRRGRKPASGNVYGLGLKSVSKNKGRFNNVYEFDSIIHAVFIRMAYPGEYPYADLWPSEGRHVLPGKAYSSKYITIPVPRVIAKDMKSKIAVGFAIWPNAPYTLFGHGTHGPNSLYRNKINTTTFVFNASMKCAIFTDPSGRILKTVVPAK